MSREPHGAPPTSDRLRADIDRGATGEKVAASDPALAPLGTDDEAAGTPVTPRQAAMEAAARPRATATAPKGTTAVPLFVAGIVAVGLAILAFAWLS